MARRDTKLTGLSIAVMASLVTLAGCSHQSTTIPSASPAQLVAATSNQAIPQAMPADVQPYTIIAQLPPKPAVLSHQRRTLTVKRQGTHIYLADSLGDTFQAGRDSQGNLYPIATDPATGTTSPLYYDSERDKYYRVISEKGQFLRCYYGDNSDRYYEDTEDYNDYQPPTQDRPVICVSRDDEACVRYVPVVVCAYVVISPNRGNLGTITIRPPARPKPQPVKHPDPVRPIYPVRPLPIISLGGDRHQGPPREEPIPIASSPPRPVRQYAAPITPAAVSFSVSPQPVAPQRSRYLETTILTRRTPVVEPPAIAAPTRLETLPSPSRPTTILAPVRWQRIQQPKRAAGEALPVSPAHNQPVGIWNNRPEEQPSPVMTAPDTAPSPVEIRPTIAPVYREAAPSPRPEETAQPTISFAAPTARREAPATGESQGANYEPRQSASPQPFFAQPREAAPQPAPVASPVPASVREEPSQGNQDGRRSGDDSKRDKNS